MSLHNYFTYDGYEKLKSQYASDSYAAKDMCDKNPGIAVTVIPDGQSSELFTELHEYLADMMSGSSVSAKFSLKPYKLKCYFKDSSQLCKSDDTVSADATMVMTISGNKLIDDIHFNRGGAQLEQEKRYEHEHSDRRSLAHLMSLTSVSHESSSEFSL